MSEEEEP
jgi:hypothetical protein